MIQDYLRQIGFLLLIIALQALVFNHVHIYGYATPFICVYFILTLPLSTPRWAKLLWGFGIGLVQDMFANTPGIMAATLTMVAMLQNFLLTLLGAQNNEDKDEAVSPSLISLGMIPFLRYMAVGVLLQNTLFYLLVTFSFASFTDIVLNITGSTILSFLIIWFIESIRCNTMKR